MEQNNSCTENRRFDTLERDIEELKQRVKETSTDIAALKEAQTETRIYLKQIFERLDDIKAMFNTSYAAISQLVNTSQKEGNSTVKDVNANWLKVTIELIKAIGIVAGIVAGLKLLGGA